MRLITRRRQSVSFASDEQNCASLQANWPKRDKMEAAIENLHVEIRKMNRPKSHRFVFERAKWKRGTGDRLA